MIDLENSIIIDKTKDDLKEIIKQDFLDINIDDEIIMDILTEWLHIKARQIPIRQRIVVLSDNISNKLYKYPQITDIKEKFIKGESLEKYLSKSTRELTKTISRMKIFNANSIRKYDDLLFNDWQISHLHLPSHKSQTSGEILYLYINCDKAIFLDILEHKNWSNQNLIKQLYCIDSSLFTPLEGFEIDDLYTNQQIMLSRKNGSATFPIIKNNTPYFLKSSFSITASGHAHRLINFSNQLKRMYSSIYKENKSKNCILRLCYNNGIFYIYCDIKKHCFYSTKCID